MTDYIDVPLLANGDWIDAAWLNQYLGDNMRAWQQGFVVGGDLPYALDANTLAALAIGAAGTFLKSTGSAPSWASARGVNAIATKDFSGGNTNSTSYQTMTAALSLVTTKTCTVIAIVTGSWRKLSATANPAVCNQARVTINGVEYNTVLCGSNLQVPFTLLNIQTGVAAGSQSISAEYRQLGGDTAYIEDDGAMFAIAFEE